MRKPYLLAAAAVVTATLAMPAVLTGCGGAEAKNEPASAIDKTGAKAISPPYVSSNPDSVAMVFVEGGTFMMGCTAEQGCHKDDEPARSVTLRDFYIGETEVTQGLWKAVMGSLPSGGCDWYGDSVSFKYGIGDNYPVYFVNWYDAYEFIEKLNARTGKKYRLPTDAEWEYAARGGNRSGGYKYSGSNNIDDVAWYGENKNNGKSHPAGTKQPNELGLYDMSGNVNEWTNNKGRTTWGSIAYHRGGGWDNIARAEEYRVSYRNGLFPSSTLRTLGFRLALSADNDTSSLEEEEATAEQEVSPPDVSSNPDSIVMVYVKGGTFMMGCTKEQGKDCKKPARKVTVRDFYIARYECSYGLWKAVMGIKPAYYAEEDNLPVNLVSWNEAQEFIRKLNAKTGRKYRLPTEEEWEYAARGGNKSKGYRYSGSNNVDEVAWYCDSSCVDWETNHGGFGQRRHPVGTKAPNELGLHDMSGNLMEWAGGSYVLRGGGWLNGEGFCRVSARATGSGPDDDGSLSDGFRLALDP